MEGHILLGHIVGCDFATSGLECGLLTADIVSGDLAAPRFRVDLALDIGNTDCARAGTQLQVYGRGYRYIKIGAPGTKGRPGVLLFNDDRVTVLVIVHAG